MASHLWKVRSKKASGKIAIGMEVEVIRKDVSGKPTMGEVKAAFKQKYGFEANIDSLSNFDMAEMK